MLDTYCWRLKLDKENEQKRMNERNEPANEWTSAPNFVWLHTIRLVVVFVSFFVIVEHFFHRRWFWKPGWTYFKLLLFLLLIHIYLLSHILHSTRTLGLIQLKTYKTYFITNQINGIPITCYRGLLIQCCFIVLKNIIIARSVQFKELNKKQ